MKMLLERKLQNLTRRVKEKGVFGYPIFFINCSLYNLFTKKQLPDRCFTSPIHLQVETSRVCNLNCKMCEYSYGKNKGQLLNLENFNKIISQFPYLDSLDLTGIGEPFCNPDFIQMIKSAKDKGVRVEFSTNGTLLDKNNIEELVKLGVDKICFSMDAATKETYENIRIGASFDKVTRNISLLTKEISKTNSKKTKVYLSYIITKENIDEIVKFPYLAKELGVKNIFYRDLITFDSSPYTKEDTFAAREESVRKEIRDELMSLSVSLGMGIGLSESLLISAKPRKKMCYRPWKSCFVDVFGNLYPCCHVTQKNRDIMPFSFGNIIGQEDNGIWNGLKYKSLRKGVSHPTQIPELCKGCDCLIK